MDIRQKAWVGVAIAANQLSASMFRFTNYSSLRQRDIAWVGHLSRELFLLNICRADLSSAWQRVGEGVIQDFSQ